MSSYIKWVILFQILIGIGDVKCVWRNFKNLNFLKIPVINMDQNQIIDFKIF